MNVESKLEKLGLELPNLEDLYRTNSSGAHYISHYPVQNLLYLSGTTPRKGGQPYLPGVVGKDLTLQQGYEAARYAALMTLAAVKYALGDLDRVQQLVHLLGFVNSAPGFGDQPRVIKGRRTFSSSCSATVASPRGRQSAVRDWGATLRSRSS
jgi:YjgF/chorismate_mutase-like, putative endoribonuclease